MEDNLKKKSGAGKGVFVIIIFIIIGCLAASNFVGPGKGWINKISKGKEKGKKIVLEESDPVKPEPTKPNELTYMVEPGEETNVIDKKVDPVEEEKSEVKDLYDTLFTKYRQKYPDPEIGKEYNVYLKTGSTRGTLKDFSDGKIVIQKPGVTATYRLDTIRKKSYPQLFPKTAAKILALREMKKILDERMGEEEQETVNDIPTGSASSPTTTSAEAFAYEPGSQPSPKNLQKPLGSFAEWVKVQQRRVGGKIGDKLYAKQQGRNVVLYMQTSNLFDTQDYDVRFTITEAMWQIWGFKCMDYGAARGTSQTHIVLVDKKNQIIGGSTQNDSSNIWVKK